MSKRILVVDDDDSMRLTLAANLELEGFEVVETTDATHALQLLESDQHFDLVLSDIRMPGLNGVELFDRIQARHAGLPVVLMTAFTSDEELQRAVQSGVYTVVSKPFDIDRTTRVLLRALDRPSVLVIDDLDAVASTTAEALRAAGVRANAVTDGEEAIEQFADGTIDVCIVDLVMPGLSGLEVARRVRASDASAAIIVFSGAPSADELMRAAAGEGAYRCLRKPLEIPELLATIAEARGRGV